MPGSQIAFERTAPSTPHLLVTFADAPTSAVALARLAGLGTVTGVVPEAGVWSIVPRDAATARDAALRRPSVSGAEWSEKRTSQELPPAPLPARRPRPRSPTRSSRPPRSGGC